MPGTQDVLLKKANAGDAFAQADLGDLYRLGQGVEQNYVTARGWYEQAAAQNNAQAKALSGFLYQDGHGNYVVTGWYEQAAAQNYAHAQACLGNFYRDGLGVERNYVTARGWYERAAAKNHAHAQAGLGYLYYNGLGVERNYVTARGWYEQAAAQNHANAQACMGDLYRDGDGVLGRNYVTARGWYEQAAAQNYELAQANLGYLYYHGHGVERNYVTARGWYEQAAAQNNPHAQYTLGILYEQGLGGLKDYPKAVTFYRQAAKQGEVLAIAALARLKEPLEPWSLYGTLSGYGSKLSNVLTQTGSWLVNAGGAVVGAVEQWRPVQYLIVEPQEIFHTPSGSSSLNAQALQASIEDLRQQFSSWATSNTPAVNNESFLDRLSAETKQYLETLKVEERQELNTKLNDLAQQQAAFQTHLEPIVQAQQANIELQKAVEDINKDPQTKMYFETLLRSIDGTLLASLVIYSGRVAQAPDLGARLLSGAAGVASVCFPPAAPFLLLANQVVTGLKDAQSYKDMKKLTEWVSISSDIAHLSLAIAVACTQAKQHSIKTKQLMSGKSQTLLAKLKTNCHVLFEQFKVGEFFEFAQEQAVVDAYLLLSYMMTEKPKNNTQHDKTQQLVEHLTGQLLTGILTAHNTNGSSSGVMGSGQDLNIILEKMKLLEDELEKQKEETKRLKKRQEERDKLDALLGGFHNNTRGPQDGSQIQIQDNALKHPDLPQNIAPSSIFAFMYQQTQEHRVTIGALVHTTNHLQDNIQQVNQGQDRLYIQLEREKRAREQQIINESTRTNVRLSEVDKNTFKK